MKKEILGTVLICLGLLGLMAEPVNGNLWPSLGVNFFGLILFALGIKALGRKKKPPII